LLAGVQDRRSAATICAGPRGWTLDETRSTDAMIGDVLTAFFTARADQVRAVTTSRGLRRAARV
jgi:hypothetical protein